MQQRLRRFIRQPELLQDRQLTGKGLEALAIIERYRLLPSSLIIRLAPGGQRNNYRHLQTLFHKGLVNRFAMPTVYGTPGEFIYYLDSAKTLGLLTEAGLFQLPEDERRQREELVRLNREKNYANLHRDPDMHGKLLFIQHEIMVSRFHALLEMACKKLAGAVILEQWKQGAELWNRIEVPKLRHDAGTDTWVELDRTEALPHRPDAFFTLYFPKSDKRSHFLYEADRGTENTTRFRMKLRAHYHFVVKHNLQRITGVYNIHSFRAVLIETTSKSWRENLREAARHRIVSSKPCPLFWFTHSEHFTELQPPATGNGRGVPLYLQQPQTIFKRIWQTCHEDQLLNLAD